MIESHWTRLGDEHPEHAPPGWAWTNGLLFGFAESDGHELLEPGACRIQHAERSIPGVDQGSCFFDDVTQQVLKLDVRGDHHDRGHEALQLLCVPHPRIRHGNRSYPSPCQCQSSRLPGVSPAKWVGRFESFHLEESSCHVFSRTERP